MSNSISFYYNDHRFIDIPEAEFVKRYQHIANAKELFQKLKDALPDGNGSLQLTEMDGMLRYRINGIEWLSVDEKASVNSAQVEKTEINPRAEIYKLQLKADIAIKANGGKPFGYQVSLNDHGAGTDEQLEHFFPQCTSLRDLTSTLHGIFKVSNEELMKCLPELDIGTFQLDLRKDGDSYKISRLYQAQAPSQKKDNELKTANEIKDLKKEKDLLSAEIIKLNGEISQLQRKSSNYDILKKTNEEYSALLDKLGILKGDNSKFEDLSLASRRDAVIVHINGIIKRFIGKDLPFLGFDQEGLRILKEKIESFVKQYVLTQASREEIDVLGSTDSLEKLQENSSALYKEITSIVADRILHFFSSPDTRKDASSVKTMQKTMQKYDLEFFFIEPGAESTTKECRFVSVRESGYARGACVETVALGIRKFGSKSVIYKADVIIST